MIKLKSKALLATLVAVLLVLPQLSWAPHGGSFGGGGRSFGGGGLSRSFGSRSFGGTTTRSGSFSRRGVFGGVRTFTGTSTTSGARSSRSLLAPPVLPSGATRQVFSYGGTNYRSYRYGGWSDYSYYWSPWSRPAWYYYTPFHPAFFFSPPYYANGYYYPGGFSWFRLFVGLAFFAFVIWLIGKLFRGGSRSF